MFIVITIICFGCYILTAMGASVCLWQFHLKVNGYEARSDWIAKIILSIICLFWPCIILISLINFSLYGLKKNV